MRNQPRIALEGIGGVYNYGCEAIVRGTQSILHRFCPGAEVAYVSYRPAEDHEALHDTPVAVTDGRPRRSRFSRMMKRLRRRVGLPPASNNGQRYRWAAEADCILSIGGDILTLWPHQRESDTFPQVDHLNRLIDRGTPVVLWGASVGPFEENPSARAAFGGVLRRLALITPREPVTYDYLTELGIPAERIALAADPAFLMKPAPADDPAAVRHGPRPGRTTVAVNLSPLSIDYALGATRREAAARAQAGAVGRLVEMLDVDVLLVPHVVCPWRPEDDDLGYLQQVAAAVPAEHTEQVRVLRAGLGARRTKAIIARCDALAAARMHCAIAGMSSGVPTLLLSYSAKALGMAEYVFGDRELVLPVDADGGALVAAVAGLLQRGEEICSRLRERLPAVREHAMANGEALARLLSAGPGEERGSKQATEPRRLPSAASN